MIEILKKQITFRRIVITLSIFFLMSFAYVSNEDYVIRFKNYVTSFVPNGIIQPFQKSTGCSCSKKANALPSPKGEEQPAFECPLVTLRNKLLEELEKASQREKMKEATVAKESTPIVDMPETPPVAPSVETEVPSLVPPTTNTSHAAPAHPQPISDEMGK
ncbi:conserved rodent malaria protein, unknown function [Plasmodium berghei]|nr:conserved rodent malaria protein, unknown function [Plasmodium berghei]SCL81525.1 conserved rodent malaria protein, unknown function [Plasmodium berghei]SCL81801.1 conserved rodent malaria protein, unknown function [Plasmodium berghei]